MLTKDESERRNNVSVFIVLVLISAILGGLKILPFRSVIILNTVYAILSFKFFSKYFLNKYSFYWVLYLLLCIIVALPNTHYLDLSIAFKWILLLIIGMNISEKNLFPSVEKNLKFYRILCNIYILFYFILAITTVKRQEIFLIDESNFETLLLLIPSIYFVLLKRLRPTDILKLFFVMVLSGSRSSILEFGVVLIAYINNFDIAKKRKISLFIFGLALLSFLFFRRESNIQEIDRYKFLLFFLQEINQFSILELLFGPERITPVSQDICNSLGYYKTLFSRGPNENICYAVIYHSFFLRIIRDHGLIITFSGFYTFYRFLKKTDSKSSATYVLLILLINSLSVSGLANSFLWIGIFISPKKYKDEKINKHVIKTIS